MKPPVCDYKKHQSTKFYKKAKKKSSYMQSKPRPAKLQSDYKKKDHVNCNQISMNDDKTCQSIVCPDTNCQETPNIHIWPVKTAKESNYMQSVTRSSNGKSVELTSYKKMCSDKNCQSTRCYKKKSSVTPMYGNDKNCQSTQNMKPKKSISNMQSVTKSSIMWLPKPTRKQDNYKKFSQDEKNGNLPSLLNLCVIARTVNQQSVFICGQQ